MSDIYGVLSIGSKALRVQQKGIHVTGNNIANVNTPGYTRQRLNLANDVPLSSSIGPLGSGVQAIAVERVYQRFLGVQINNETQGLGRWESYQDTLKRVEMIFDESGGYGLNHVMSEFWNAWQDLSNDPAGQTERTILVAKSEMLALTFNKNYQDLQALQKDFDAMIRATVEDINQLAQEIVDLNQKIIQIESGRQYAANDYRDQRDLALKELASLIDISSFEAADGSVSVSVASGHVLAEGTHSHALSTRQNAFGLLDITWPDPNANLITITDNIAGGKLKGWLDARNFDIRNFMIRLDNLAQTIMQEVNTLHANGYGLDGSTGNDFFTGAATASGILDSVLTITAEQGGAGNLNIELSAGGTAGAETVTADPVTGDIRIAIEDGVSTRAQIAVALQAHPSIASVVVGAPPNAAWTLGTGTDSVTLTGGSSAGGIQVNLNIVNDMNMIAAAQGYDLVPGDKPGDNGNAIAVVNLQNSLSMNGSSATFDAYYNSLVSDVGLAVQQAGSYFDHQSDMVQHLENYRESVSGVSIDEEMINLVKFQNAYQAAAKLITTADEMMQSVLNML